MQHFIFSSLPSPEAITRGRVSELHHYEGKVDVVKYIRGLKPVDGKAGGNGKSLGDVTTLVWAGYYMENFARWDLNAYLRPRKVRRLRPLLPSLRLLLLVHGPGMANAAGWMVRTPMEVIRFPRLPRPARP